jgi:hypothetical protein
MELFSFFENTDNLFLMALFFLELLQNTSLPIIV